MLSFNHRYVHGFKYCKSCEKWIASGKEKYINEHDKANHQRARCPDCNHLLKTRPRNAKGKERLAKFLGVEVKRY
jgi:DNA-directed RNA polymerase subunit RPC12/RpoP